MRRLCRGVFWSLRRGSVALRSFAAFCVFRAFQAFFLFYVFAALLDAALPQLPPRSGILQLGFSHILQLGATSDPWLTSCGMKFFDCYSTMGTGVRARTSSMDVFLSVATCVLRVRHGRWPCGPCPARLSPRALCSFPSTIRCFSVVPPVCRLRCDVGFGVLLSSTSTELLVRASGRLLS